MEYGQILLGIFIALINAILWYFVKRAFDRNEQNQKEHRREIQLISVEIESFSEAVGQTLLNGNRQKYEEVRKAKKSELMEALKYIHK